MKILFQGDSITDAGRVREDSAHLGYGYPKYAAERLRQQYPDTPFTFLNRGISGDQTKDLVARWQVDCIDLQPDIVSILVGVNDTWHHVENRDWVPNEKFEANYRFLLTELRAKTTAKILMIEPFVLPVPDKAVFREDMDGKTHIVRKLAREFADEYLPLDGLLAAACVHHEATYWAEDGVHPNENGSRFIAERYVEAIRALL